MTEVAHDVAGHATRTATYEKDAEGQGRLQMEDTHQQPRHAGHDDELSAGADEDVQRTARQHAEILRGQRQAHRQHDDAEDGGLGVAPHPVEEGGEEEGENGNGRDKQRSMRSQRAAEASEHEIMKNEE